MNYSTNYNLNKPERSEQFNIDHWNNNTDAIDSQMHTNEVNITQNATDIATLFTGLNTKNTSDTNSVFYKLMKLIYPVGSLYWSANNTNPSTLFGGTWTQIKDKFVLACGDTYSTTGATGGASSVTLAVTNLPSHNHSIGGSTGSTQPTFTGTAVTSGANSRGHTHSVGAHSHTINSGNTSSSGTATTAGFRGVAVTSGGMSDNSVGTVILFNPNGSSAPTGNISRSSTFTSNGYEGTTEEDRATYTINVAHTHSVTASGYLYGKTDNSTAFDSGTESQTHTHSVTASGTVSSHSHTLPANTGSKGDGTAFSIMPPYVVKYCWQRTA